MNDLQIFNNPDFGEIRTLTENGAVLFCGSDIAKAALHTRSWTTEQRHSTAQLSKGNA